MTWGLQEHIGPTTIALYREVSSNGEGSGGRLSYLRSRIQTGRCRRRLEPGSSIKGSNRTVETLQTDPIGKVPTCGAFAEPSNGLEPSTPLTMERLRQPVATHGNGFRLSGPFQRPCRLPAIATDCDRWAP